MPKSTPSKPKRVHVTLIKSPIGYSKRHKATIRALGLRRMNQTVEQVDTPTLRGMLAMVDHLVVVEESTED
jgi:large subunit ribosomal protein L30